MEYRFEKLTPNNNVDISVYDEAITFAFDNEDVKNIAISGPYGAGKSSVLSSYKKSNPEKKFIHVSLAHFEKDEENPSNYETILERKILNQLIHQIDPKRIPQTKFKVKRPISWGTTVLYAAGVFAALLLLVPILLYKPWSGFLVKLFPYVKPWFVTAFLKATITPWFRLIAGIIIAVILFIFIYIFIKTQRERNMLKKLNLNGTEIDLTEDCNDSLFDKYLNEVLYLFKRSKIDAIVFEDIDRYDNCKIFERLREINTLANCSFKKKNKRVIRFFYLIKDDIFLSKDRTKFFDFIIPIIPVMDGSNAYNQFKEHFENNKIFEKFDSAFLQGVSLYVDEMRLLKNICNEFLVYYRRIGDQLDLDPNKMLAMIIYKNLFPKDFSDLQLGRGYVEGLFQKKKDLIDSETSELKDKIKQLEQRKIQLDSEPARTQEELELIFKNKIDRYYRNFSDWLSYLSVQDQREYKERQQFVEEKTQQKIDDNEELLAQTITRLVTLSSATFSDLINRENVDAIFGLDKNNLTDYNSYKEIKTNNYFNLLKYLVRNGFIDETYPDYLTYFYPNSLSVQDKNFLISITDKVAKNPNFTLNHPELVFERLDLPDYEQEEILNYDLLTYLLEKHKESPKLVAFLNQLKRTKNYDFVFNYFSLDSQRNSFVVVTNQNWPRFFHDFFSAKSITGYPIAEYSVVSLCNCSDELLSEMNVDRCITNYISQNPEYLSIADPDVETLIEKFQELSVCFESINYATASKTLLTAVYENSLYALSFDNIKLMLQVYGAKEPAMNPKTQNYSMICLSLDSPLYKYVSANINEYVDAYLDFCEGQIEDNEASALRIINNAIILEAKRQAYIQILEECICDLRNVEDTAMWSLILSSKAIIRSENNVLEYYSYSEEIDTHLVDYINSFAFPMDYNKVEFDRFDPSLIENFLEDFFCENAINDEQYQQFVSKLKFKWESISSKDISCTKMSMLIDSNIIVMNPENLTLMREHYTPCVMAFIRKNLLDYVDIMDEDLISDEELGQILSWDIDDSLKLSLLHFSNASFSIVGKTYSNKIKLHIWENNRDETDLSALCTGFSSLTKTLKTAVYSIVRTEIDYVIKNRFVLANELFRKLLDDQQIELSKKVKLLIAKIDRYSKEDFLFELSSLGVTGFESVFDKTKRPKIEITLLNKVILDAFVNNRWISSYHEDSQRKGCYSLIRTLK